VEGGGQERVKWFPQITAISYLSFCFVLPHVCGGCHQRAPLAISHRSVLLPVRQLRCKVKVTNKYLQLSQTFHSVSSPQFWLFIVAFVGLTFSKRSNNPRHIHNAPGLSVLSSNIIRSGPVRSGPVRSCPVRSGPIRSGLVHPTDSCTFTVTYSLSTSQDQTTRTTAHKSPNPSSCSAS
jgi:hypothetical protein